MRRRFYQTRENNLKQNHIWFSVFSRPPRSRYTRCQRVTCCAVYMFLSMLGNAMWFGVVAQPSTPGFDVFGLFTLSWEEILMALIINAMTFPFVFLIMFLFKFSKPSKLRSNRIVKSLQGDTGDNGTENEESDKKESDEDSEDDDDQNDDDTKSQNSLDTVKEAEEADTKSLVSVGMYMN